ncbi:LOW QUALITY PROTEIN: testis-specific protein TEX28 [Lynx rufus]|uniref:LOW QUALITY PROTEIN: testis-specific protein TEX28 n=1 Tax=Lynx rufus TaxID=61384 RepID=UPI001F12765D|nr:LOW QUALITY PROTEIN: testis-specific protein TEX28 [Lynx rufus]
MVLKAEYTKSPSAAILSDVSSCRSLSSSEDGTPPPRGHSSLSDGELARNLQDSVKHRFLYLSEQRRLEKASREENTVGYLKLVSKADQHHAPHIWQDFEKVNQCASATIAQIERRLCRCHRQLQGLEGGWRPQGLAPKAESSPRHCRRPSEKAPSSESPRPGGEDCLSTNLSDIVRHLPLASHFPALWPGKSWGTKLVAQQRNLLSRQMKEDLREVRELHLSLQVSYPSLKESRLMGLQVSLVSLQEQKCRQASVEEQVNEHVQGYPDDICHLEQNLARAEEKMAYLSYEGAKEIWSAGPFAVTGHARTLPGRRSHWPPAFICTVCTCPPTALSSGPHTCAALVLIGLGALAWQKRRSVSATDRQAWVPSRWRRRSEEPEPLAGGP